MNERTAWVWEYGIEVVTPDQGTKVHWDDGQYPQGRHHMEQRVSGLRQAFRSAGSLSVSSVKLVRRKKWTKTITWYERKENAR